MLCQPPSELGSQPISVLFIFFGGGGFSRYLIFSDKGGAKTK